MAWRQLPPTIEPWLDRTTSSSILVISSEGIARHGLPGAGKLRIGRNEESEIRLADPSISRDHAIIHVGPPLELEDLGSANGTRVSGVVVARGQKTSLHDGDVIAIGESLLVVQPRRAFDDSRRLWSHADFEGRLEEACRTRTSRFAILRISVEGSSPKPSQISVAFGRHLSATDMIAYYADGEYEILSFVGQDHTAAQRTADAIRRSLSEQGLVARIGIACFPEDGTTPERILGKACARARTSAVEKDTDSAPVVEASTMRELYRVAERIAVGTISVLLLGETGAGKEVFAATIHQKSPRARKKFVAINCGAFAEGLIESELFGHEKGAFSGAIAQKIGLIEHADGGTIFLDEIGELPPSAQVKLLRVLENREFTRVGGLEPKKVDVRVIAATNRDPETEIARGTFREDLYFRLNGVSLLIPPLRERVSEIAPLARRFADRACADLGWRNTTLSSAALELLESHSWPGNIRELRNVIERAVLLSEGDEIDLEHLPIDKLSVAWRAHLPAEEVVDAGNERAQIIRTLQECAGNQSRAAKQLGLSRRTLVKKLGQLAIPRPRKGADDR